MRWKARPAFADARKKKPASHKAQSHFDPSQPRSGDGRWIPAGKRLEAAASVHGSVPVHVEFAQVRRPGQVKAITGEDVTGFRHAASNQAMTHSLRNHGNPKSEAARGQVAVLASDFMKLPEIVRSGRYVTAKQREFGPRRIQMVAEIEGATYHYVAEIRAKKRRIDMVTMWKT